MAGVTPKPLSSSPLPLLKIKWSTDVLRWLEDQLIRLTIELEESKNEAAAAKGEINNLRMRTQKLEEALQSSRQAVADVGPAKAGLTRKTVWPFPPPLF